MASPSLPPPVKLICGMLSSRRELLEQAKVELEGQFGAVDDVSEIMDFGFTHYYDEELGTPLLRQFVSFGTLLAPESLVEAKHATNAMEQAFAQTWLRQTAPQTTAPGACHRDGRSSAALPRTINLDPGFVDSPKLVLASMKNYAHRIHLGRGVYAEITLLHRRGRWTPLEWTFPDYASGLYWPFLDRVRKRLREQLGTAGIMESGSPACAAQDPSSEPRSRARLRQRRSAKRSAEHEGYAGQERRGIVPPQSENRA